MVSEEIFKVGKTEAPLDVRVVIVDSVVSLVEDELVSAHNDEHLLVLAEDDWTELDDEEKWTEADDEEVMVPSELELDLEDAIKRRMETSGNPLWTAKCNAVRAKSGYV